MLVVEVVQHRHPSLDGFVFDSKGTDLEDDEEAVVVVVVDKLLSMRRFLIAVINDRNALSTLTLVFAEHSKKGMWNSSASESPCFVETLRESTRSHLFPTRTISTASFAESLIERIQSRSP
jgi:hypothetical protein